MPSVFNRDIVRLVATAVMKAARRPERPVVSEQLRRAATTRDYDIQTTTVNGERASILVVDDDESSREMLAYCLCKQYICTTAATAEEAMDLLDGRFFDVVITDIEMPGASGLELCRHIRKTCPDAIVLVMSAAADSRNRIKALQLGAFDYLSKPLNLETVERLIEYALLPPPA